MMDQIVKIAWELNDNCENRYQLVYEIAELAKKLVDETCIVETAGYQPKEKLINSLKTI